MKQRGMILPIILIILSFITSTLCMYLSISTLQFGITQNHYFYLQNLQRAQFFLQKIQETTLSSFPCRQQPHEISWFAQQPESWWQNSSACHDVNNIAWVYIPLHFSRCDFLNNHPVEYDEVIIHAGKRSAVNLAAILALPMTNTLPCKSTKQTLSKVIQGQWVI